MIIENIEIYKHFWGYHYIMRAKKIKKVFEIIICISIIRWLGETFIYMI